MAELPSQDYLKSRVYYNPDTGEVRWKPVDESYGPGWKIFNSRFAGNLLTNKLNINDKQYHVGRVVYKILYGIDVHKVIYADGDRTNFKKDNISTRQVQERLNVSHKTVSPLNSIPEIARELLDYDHIAGDLIWRTRNNNQFNATYAGKVAGSLNVNGYMRIKIGDSFYGTHRVAWFLYYGVDPSTYHIDHINGIKNDNQISNLRLANHSFNASQYSKAAPKYNATKNKFTVEFNFYDKVFNVGLFDTEAEARAAYEEALAKYKPVYQFTEEEQAELDELYANYPNVTRELQHRCHALQVKALNHYIEGAAQ